ncbi:MAG: phosphatidylglycerophosphatase A [Opitutaceae bacterium]|jgi:phosphatidylglycerophosphatase A|nr:phosphatidylglycerophosphatase A [Opitutaceae bacterium]
MTFRQPTWPRFIPSGIVLAIARVGPCGRARRAPGTWGSFAGLFWQLLVFHYLSLPVALLLCVPALLFSVAFCGEAEFRLGERDPGQIVLDEFVAIPLCFLGWPAIAHSLPHWAAPWGIYVAAFALFRLYDIAKPLGIARLQNLPGGWGVTLDDTAAALATCATLHLAAWALRA